jgi:hypothetical protein
VTVTATSTVTVVASPPTDFWEQIEVYATSGAPKPSAAYWEHIKIFDKKPWKRTVQKRNFKKDE